MWREKRGGKYYTAQRGEGAHDCNRTVPGSALCLNRGVGCVTSVQTCDYSHHLIKSHIANLLSPVKVTDYTSNLLVTGGSLVALSTTWSKCPFMARWTHANTPSQRLCIHLHWAGGSPCPFWLTSAALSGPSQAEESDQGTDFLLALRQK